MSGTKTIKNNSNVTISVVLRGRKGSDPSGGSLPPVSASIAPEKSATLQYGNDQNPYLNELQVEENSNGSDIRQTYTTTSRGGPRHAGQSVQRQQHAHHHVQRVELQLCAERPKLIAA